MEGKTAAEVKTGRNQEQRKHTRVRHSGSVIVKAEGGNFVGSAVNISRSGMQVVVNMPASYREVRSVTFRLPAAAEALEIPCRLVRAEKDDPTNPSTLLGVEIDCQSEAQMILIEGFVRDSVFKSIINGSKESRRLPRRQCSITGVSTNRADLKVQTIENISSEGLLLSFQGNLKTGDALFVEFSLPGDNRRLKLAGEVLYVIGNVIPGTSAAGIKFLSQSPVVQARIKNFIVTSASGSAMRSVCEGFYANGLAHDFRITDRGQIIAAFRRLHDEGLILNSLFDGNLQILELKVLSVNEQDDTWTAGCVAGSLHRDFAMPTRGYFSFWMEGGSHYFRSDLHDWSDGTPALKIPQILYRSEKRSSQRKPVSAASAARSISLRLKLNGNASIQGRILDVGQHGFLCEIPLSEEILERIQSGKPLQYSVREGSGLSYPGEIRHFSQSVTVKGDLCLRIGIETGVTRSKYRFRQFSPSLWSKKSRRFKAQRAICHDRLVSEVISCRNKNAQRIIALLNRTGDPSHPSPVVIIPPAFGKKKEVTAALAATLITNFRKNKQNLVILRYDGINRPGESFSEEKEPKRGYEMLHYRIGQGLDDLRTIIDFVYDNTYFKPDRVALISSSMSALECRRLLAQGDSRVHFWINLMGVPAAQSVLINTLGGLDIIGNARMGILNGINGLLGQLVDMDVMARDLIDHRYAFLSDARQDMSRISIPVLWIYGTYDRWLSPDEVRDIMSVQSGAERDILEVPTGHNLRSSEDALRSFRLVTSWLYSRLFGHRINACEPNREQLVRLICWERERLFQPQPIEPRDYWKSYLLGDDRRSEGYDFYRNLQDFKAFFATQAALIRPEEGGRIADMGCGTGLMVEQLLERISSKGKSRDIAVTAVDLVPEALERTRQKWRKVLQRHPDLKRHKLECRQMDLTPNRLVPVYNFVNRRDLPLAYLNNRIEGLTADILQGIRASSFPGLRSVLEGELIKEETGYLLKQDLLPEECAAVLDFNRIARFLKERLRYGDLISYDGDPTSPVEKLRYRTLQASELRMERLNFGSCTRDLRLPFADSCFDKVIASLLLSYLPNPEYVSREFFRLLKPGGSILASSMKPDSDISTIYTTYIQDLQSQEPNENTGRDRDLMNARIMLNEAAGLLQLEEEGYFRFYNAKELQELVECAGFHVIEVLSSLGSPSQAVIVIAKKPY